MQIKFQVDRRAAVKRGINATSQITTLDVEPSQISEEDRLLLADRLTQAGEVVARKSDGRFVKGNTSYSTVAELDTPWRDGQVALLVAQGITVADMIDAIRAEDAAVEAEKKAAVEKKAAEKAERIAKTLAVIDAKKTTKGHLWAKVSRNSDGTLKVTCESYSPNSHEGAAGFGTYRPDWTCESDEDVMKSAPAFAWIDELEAKNSAARDAAIKAATLDLEAKEKAAKEKAARDAEIANARTRQIDAWVAQHGSASQKARHKERLLPTKEATDALRDEAFTPLAGRKLYEKIAASEVCECGGFTDYDADPCGITCEVEDDCELTEGEYADLVEFRRLMPTATITPKLHACEGKACNGTCERKSLRVEIVVGAFTFSREYAV